MLQSGRRPESISKALPVLRVLSHYFRAEVRGLDKIPSGPALLVGNHSGGMGSPDFVFTVSFLSRFGVSAPLFILGHRLFTNAPLLGRFLRRFGIVAATARNATRILRDGGKVLIYPGADLDSLRPFKDRKKIKFGGQTGFIRIALLAGVPIVPIVTAGSHETFFVAAQGIRVAEWLKLDRLLGLRTFPIVFCLPWILTVGPLSLVPYWPLPAKVTVQVGEPISIGEEEGGDLEAACWRVHGAMQAMLDALYARRRFHVLG